MDSFIDRLFLLEEFIEVALENASERNQHVNGRVVPAMLYLAEDACSDIDAL